MTVTFEPQTDSDRIEAIYEGAYIAGIEPGDFDAQGTFKSDAPGFTVSYGRGFERSKHFDDVDAAKAWIDRRAEDLRDY
jgi:hypothetical protein